MEGGWIRPDGLIALPFRRVHARTRSRACALTPRSRSPLGRVRTRVAIHFRDIKGIPACPERFLRDGTANDLLHRPFPVTLSPFSFYPRLYFSVIRRKRA